MTMPVADGIMAGAVSETTHARLADLVSLLRKWNPAINLVAPGSLDDAWRRHVADSAQLFGHRPPAAKSWLDLGSGGGFPGLVIAVLAQDAAPDLRIELVDSDQRKCAFLQTATRELGLSVTVTCGRIEALSPRQADVVSARALAPLAPLCRYALPHLAAQGVCLFLKGVAIDAELIKARKEFTFGEELFPSKVDPAGVVVRLKGLTHA